MSFTHEDGVIANSGIPNSASVLSAMSSTSYDFEMPAANNFSCGKAIPTSASLMSFCNTSDEQVQATMLISPPPPVAVLRQRPVPGLTSPRQPGYLTSPVSQTISKDKECNLSKRPASSPRTPAAANFCGSNSFTSPPQSSFMFYKISVAFHKIK
jgi:hypothetical protein